MWRFGFLLAALLSSSALRAQAIIASLESPGGVRLFPGDAEALDVREVKASLPCAVTPTVAELGFDFAFHAGYTVRIRLRDLAGNGTVLTNIFRVTSDSNPDSPVYFEQKWRVPNLREDSEGAAALEGSFSIGEGDYQVDWLIRDREERVCSAFWRVSARMPVRAREISAGLQPGSVSSREIDPYLQQEASRADPRPRLSVSVLLNVGPRTPGAASVSAAESEAVLAMLRGIFREPRIDNISVTAFNLDQRQVIFEQENIRQLNHAGLAKAIASLPLGVVSLAQLAEKDAEARFLVQLAAERAERNRPDALIFVGARAADGAGMARDLLRQLGDPRCPVFYLNFVPTPDTISWTDLIGSAVRHWRGREFNISKPLDLASAWSKIMSQLGEGKSCRRRER
jgi:hypothetical protein